ncbi:nuclear transport factor 2 family protein [Nocardiopsis chromatogenes]|uniref:nuclear transport factor 2 family protein n=1 Tax=Nocardiopsis chromatogenes TaxID=280239 RepID=UPI0003481C6A|nr:nuclear transport factor 2 family protein [Nocardiopsis chromatogenes]
MAPSLEVAVDRWHTAVNGGDPDRAAAAVTDPVVVLGPKGAGPISPSDFADWVRRSGIRMRPTSRHPVSDRLMVVEQEATWPQSERPSRVATVFRVNGDRVSAALRQPDLASALELGFICREMAATE